MPCGESGWGKSSVFSVSARLVAEEEDMFAAAESEQAFREFDWALSSSLAFRRWRCGIGGGMLSESIHGKKKREREFRCY